MEESVQIHSIGLISLLSSPTKLKRLFIQMPRPLVNKSPHSIRTIDALVESLGKVRIID